MELMDAGFQAISDRLGFSIDQVRYIVLLFSTYPLSLVFRHLLHPSRLSPTARHLFALFFGVSFGLICFDLWQMSLLLFMAAVSYALLWLVSPKKVHIYLMVWAMGFLSASHTYRLLSDPGGYHLDFTGPLMMIVQKVTYLGFFLHDGLSRKDAELNEDQKEQKITVQPSPLVYASYVFGVFGFLAGPTCTIKEYVSFVDGSNLKPLDNPNQFANAKEHSQEPSGFYPGLTKALSSLASLGCHVVLSIYIPDHLPLEPNVSIIYRTFTAYLVYSKWRFRYYFVFLTTEAIDNLAGLGFSGYDKFGNAQWDLVSNVSVLTMEFPSNFRSAAVSWNTLTAKWLRRLVYERVTFSPNLVTYVVSAWWHGAYPGYFLTFVCLALMNQAGRNLRRLLRHHFQNNVVLKWAYHFAGVLLSLFSMMFGFLPFAWLWLDKGLFFWSQYYFIPFILTAVIAFLPASKKSAQSHSERRTANSNVAVPTIETMPAQHGDKKTQ